MSDSIPIRKSILDGNEKNIVVLTKEEGYRKKPSSLLGVIRAVYARYPKVYELMRDRHISYNKTLDYLEEQEKCGRAFVIRPKTASGIKRIEKDREKLIALYDQGYRDAQALYGTMLAYLHA